MTSLRTLWLITLVFPLVASAQDSHRFDAGALSLRYLEAGDGPAVVLLHGFSGSAEGLYVSPGTFSALADAGYRVIALDQRGHGRSDKPHDAASYGLEMVEDVRRLLDHLEITRAHLVGYSMGAKVAATFRVQYPERLLSVTLGGYGWPWQSAAVTIDAARARLANRTVLPGNDLEALAAVSTGMHRLTPAEAAVRDNTVPVLAIVGDSDEVVPRSDYDTLVATMPLITSVIIPGTHAGPDGAPYKPVFAREILAFLETVTAQ
jgi:pimeloyl-ACP methyl ester carboxylesterase